MRPGRKKTNYLYGTPFYGVWTNMKERCSNKHLSRYPRYSGRGIIVCERWLTFENFKEDMYKSYIEHKKVNLSTTIERIDNDGNYCKENCRWATIQEQFKNKTYRKKSKSIGVKRLLRVLKRIQNKKQKIEASVEAEKLFKTIKNNQELKTTDKVRLLRQAGIPWKKIDSMFGFSRNVSYQLIVQDIPKILKKPKVNFLKMLKQDESLMYNRIAFRTYNGR